MCIAVNTSGDIINLLYYRREIVWVEQVEAVIPAAEASEAVIIPVEV